MIITLDGPAGAGKSTVARLLAKELGFAYLDTGAMYRAAAWALLQEYGEPLYPEDIGSRLSGLPLDFAIQNGSLIITYRTQELDEELRIPGIPEEASRVSQVESVRAYLSKWQRRLASYGCFVAEGRDMGTVVFPDADIKFFVTADLQERSRRRYLELPARDRQAGMERIREDMRARDQRDRTREQAPLTQAPDAIVINTSHLSREDVLQLMVSWIEKQVCLPQKV